MTVNITLKVKEPFTQETSVRFANWIFQEVLGKDLEPVPTTNPPPKPVVGPLQYGDPMLFTFTFSFDTLEDANTFLEHILKSELIQDYWAEPAWRSPVTNVRGIERLDVRK